MAKSWWIQSKEIGNYAKSCVVAIVLIRMQSIWIRLWRLQLNESSVNREQSTHLRTWTTNIPWWWRRWPTPTERINEHSLYNTQHSMDRSLLCKFCALRLNLWIYDFVYASVIFRPTHFMNRSSTSNTLQFVYTWPTSNAMHNLLMSQFGKRQRTNEFNSCGDCGDVRRLAPYKLLCFISISIFESQRISFLFFFSIKTSTSLQADNVN